MDEPSEYAAGGIGQGFERQVPEETPTWPSAALGFIGWAAVVGAILTQLV
jgi:hypothetical protein